MSQLNNIGAIRTHPVARHPGTGKRDEPFHYRLDIPANHDGRAIIVMDDDLIGDIAIAAARSLAIGGEISPPAIMCIGFGSKDFAALHRRRGTYLTPRPIDLSSIGMDRTGHAGELRDYITRVALPALHDAMGGVPGNLTMLGYSLSGSLALEMACEGRLPLAGIAAISPSLWVDPDLSQRFAHYAGRVTDLTVYLCAGATETTIVRNVQTRSLLDEVRDLGEALSRNFPERCAFEKLLGDTHYSAPFAAMPRAMRFLCGE